MSEKQLTLADIAGIDVNEVKEMRFEVLPRIQGIFEISRSEMKMSNPFDGFPDGTPVIEVDCKVVSVDNIIGVDGDVNKDDFIGKVQTQGFLVKKLEEVGRYKAFIVDAGVKIEGKVELPALVSGTLGLQFPGQIKHRKDKNDPDLVRANVVPTVVKEQAA